MSQPLRVLLVEDSADDATLLLIQLERMGFDVTLERVQTADAFAAALAERPWDVVIADHSMPRFDAARALAILEARALDLPFVIMSGVILTASAVELMKAGAHDFVSKNEPARLEPVLRRELREAASRKARRGAEAAREQLVVQLEAAVSAKDEFLAMLGHELRNPLAPIVAALELLKRTVDPSSSRALQIIDRQVHHVLRLVEDLLDVERIAHGKIELRSVPIELAAAVANGVELARPLIAERAHTLVVDVPAAGLRVHADATRLAQVVSNLLTNAARYTPTGGAITLSARDEGDEIVLSVKDNGDGMEADLLLTIFDAFVQGGRTSDRKVGGLGLGLAIVRNLVTLHGGTVTASSGGAGCGSELTVRLPRLADHVAPRATRSTRASRPAFGSAVLLVDDNVDSSEMLSLLLRLQGYEVEVAFDGVAALALLGHFVPNVIILDIGLPGMDGLELARRIRALPAHERTRMIAVTGYGQPADRDRCLEAGFDRHIVKPIRVDELLGSFARAST